MFQQISSCHTTFEVYTITTYELLKGSKVFKYTLECTSLRPAE